MKGMWRYLLRAAVATSVIGGGATVVLLRSDGGAPSTTRTPALAFAGSVGAPQIAAGPAARKESAPVVSYSTPAVSPPLRDLRSSPGTAPPKPEIFGPGEQPIFAAAGAPDPVVQNVGPAAKAPAIFSSFDGSSNRDNFLYSGGSSRPPDNDGDVGPNHYVEWINTVIEIFDKSGAVVSGPVAGNTLFANLDQPPDPLHTDVCTTTNNGDPLVLYDQLADRWVLSQFAFNIDANTGALLPPYKQCIAVSKTNDPTGQYCTYSFLVSNTSFNDYGKIGMRPDGYYLSYGMFSGGVAYTGPGVQWVDRNAMLNCQTAASVVFTPDTLPALANQSELLPADLDGMTPPPANEPEFFLGLGTSTQLELWKFNVDTGTPANSTFSAVPTIITVPAYDTSVTSIPQKDTPNQLDAIADRLMYRLAYRNWGATPPPGIPANAESLVVNQTVDAGSNHAAVRWYEIRDPNTTPVVNQKGTYAPDAHHRWMGSAAQDKLGNLAVGYSVSGSDMYPSIRYTGRLQADPADTLRAEASMFEGPAPAPVATGTAGDPRWGDYTVLSVDPTDDCTFWYINEYMDPNKIPEDTVAALSRWWHTRIGFFRFENCPSPTAVVVKGFAARWHGKQVSVTWRTSSEADVAGFHLYRSIGAGAFRKVSRTLIPAKQAGRVRGAAYSLVDRAVKRSKTYTYRLQLVSKSGKRSWYGVGSAASR